MCDSAECEDVQCTPYTVRCILYTVYSVRRTVYIIHCTMQLNNRLLGITIVYCGMSCVCIVCVLCV